MALSQIQCLDDYNVNPRIHESKPEFFYSEEQRLALEALLRDGREAFGKYLESRGLRGFLSDLEQETLTAALEPFDPDSELFPRDAEDESEPLSLQYWPEVSDTSIPQMDLGWPEGNSYRGVTRTSVYTQPPMEGQAHIKEVVRKMIAQAQKVIAVVMDVFTDVDIFRDLLDAGFKRKVSVYILLERTMLPHFLSMCRRANMHAGHLKHLRVRCTEGAEFYTRYCTKVRGQMGHRFMFIDGDKAVSGSYSFTWMSSRLDRNLITVITGQTVDAFDQLFRFLYTTSSFVDLCEIATEPEPEPDTRHQVLAVSPPSAAIARKLYNPKYALVALSSPSAVNSNGKDNPNEPDTSEEPKNKIKRKRVSEDLPQDAPPLHPGLINLEKAYLIPYLPTWLEPDPTSDVIGFINIRDNKKASQVHLQRSEMFETSQAIKFSSPFSKPQEKLPDVAKPRKLTAHTESKPEDLLVDGAQPEQKSVGLVDNNNKEIALEQRSPLYRQKSNSDKDKAKVLQKENRLCSNTATNPDSGPLYISPQVLPQSSIKVITPKYEQTSNESQTISTTKLSEPLKESKSVKEPEILTVLKIQSSSEDRTHTLESNTTQKSQLHKPSQLNSEDVEEKTAVSQQDSHTNTVKVQHKISPVETRNVQYPGGPRHNAAYSASPMQSESSCNYLPSTCLPSTISLPTSSFPALPLLPSSASSFKSSVSPDSKPHTEQPSKQDSISSSSKTMPDISNVERSETSLGPHIVDELSTLAGVAETSPKEILDSVSQLRMNSVSKTGGQKHRENAIIPKDVDQERETVTSQESKGKEADGKQKATTEEQSITRTQPETQSDVSLKDPPKTSILNNDEIIPKKFYSKTQSDFMTKATTDSKTSDKNLTNLEFANVTNGTQTYLARCHEPQIISYSNFTLQDINVPKASDSVTAPTNCISHNTHVPKDKHGESVKSAANALSQPGKQAQLPSVDCTDIALNSMKQHTHNTLQEQACETQAAAHTSRKTLNLHLSNVQGTDLSLQTTKQESQMPAAVVQTQIQKVFPQTLPTPDAQTTSPDPGTPTPDGYFSPREDSALSTTSEEYFECNESPSHEPVLDASDYRNHGIRESYSPTYSDSPFSKNIGTCPANLNKSPSVAALSSASPSTSSSESSTVAWTCGDPSAFLVGEKGQNRGSKVTNKRNGKEEAKAEVKSSNIEKKKAQEYQSKEGKHNEELNRMPVPLKNGSDLKEMALKPSKASGRLVDGGMTEGQSMQKQPKRSSNGDLKPERVLSEGNKESSGKAKPLNPSALTPSNMETRQRQSTKDTTAQKPLHPSPKSQRRQQPTSRGSSPSRPLRSPRSPSGTQVQELHSSGNRDLNQTESRTLQSNRKVSENKPPPRRSQSRSPSPLKALPTGSASGRKQVSQSQPHLRARQPPAAQIRSKTDPPQSQTTKPQASSLHTLSNPQPQVRHHASTEKVSEQAAHELEEARVPFNLPFGRLYSFKGLKDKWTKLPTQGRSSSTGTPVKERKSTS